MDTTTIKLLTMSYGRNSKNLKSEPFRRDIEGARAALERFYYAFNHRDLEAMDQVWHAHPLAQLNNPIGGIKRGSGEIRSVYQRIFQGPAVVWVEFFDIAEFAAEDMVVFAGRERGEFSKDGSILPLAIRTTRIFSYLGPDLGWVQLHHHGSIDDVGTLGRYQQAILGMPQNGPDLPAQHRPNSTGE